MAMVAIAAIPSTVETAGGRVMAQWPPSEWLDSGRTGKTKGHTVTLVGKADRPGTSRGSSVGTTVLTAAEAVDRWRTSSASLCRHLPGMASKVMGGKGSCLELLR
jgi:hypothetical protein